MRRTIISVCITALLLFSFSWAVEGDVPVNARLPVQEGHSSRDTIEVIIGSPYIGNVIPFWGATYDASRFQVLFLQSEINTNGEIITFSFMPSSSGIVTGYYYNVTVLFCHTAVTQLSSTFDMNYSGNIPVEVISVDTMLVGGPQNVWMDWSVSFQYNSIDNLLVEIRWNGDSGTNIALWRTSESVPRRLYAWDDHASSGSLQNTGNYVRLMIVTTPGVEENSSPITPVNIVMQSMPNPFINKTNIAYEVTLRSLVTLDIYDAAGRCVNKLVDTEQIPGSYYVHWNGLDENDRSVEAGVYFCRLQVGNDLITKPIVYLK